MTIVFSAFYFEYIHSVILLVAKMGKLAQFPMRYTTGHGQVRSNTINFSDEEEWKEGLVDHRQVSQEEAHKLEADVE